MASSSLTEDLTCPICLALFQEPQMLGCGHNFCLTCLQSCIEGQKKKKGATCPECRLPFQLRDLTHNRALANLAKKVRHIQGDPEEPFLGAPNALENFCLDHEEPFKLFCLQDGVPLCVICRDLPQHRGHLFLPTKNAVDYAQGKLKPYQKLLKRKLKLITGDESVQEKAIALLESCTENILGDISNGFEVLYQTLREKEENFKKSVQEIKEKNLKEMNDVLTSLKEDRDLHTENLTKIKAALATTDHIAFLKDFKDLMDKVKKYPLEEEEDGESSGNEEKREASDTLKYDDQEEKEEEEGNDNDDRVKVILLDPALSKFRDSLDFEAWKEILLKQIKAGQENEEKILTLDVSYEEKDYDFHDHFSSCRSLLGLLPGAEGPRNRRQVDIKDIMVDHDHQGGGTAKKAPFLLQEGKMAKVFSGSVRKPSKLPSVLQSFYRLPERAVLEEEMGQGSHIPATPIHADALSPLLAQCFDMPCQKEH